MRYSSTFVFIVSIVQSVCMSSSCTYFCTFVTLYYVEHKERATVKPLRINFILPYPPCPAERNAVSDHWHLQPCMHVTITFHPKSDEKKKIIWCMNASTHSEPSPNKIFARWGNSVLSLWYKSLPRVQTYIHFSSSNILTGTHICWAPLGLEWISE